MTASKHIKHSRRSLHISYPISLGQKFYSFFIVPVVFLVIAIVIIWVLPSARFIPLPTTLWPLLFRALGASLSRIVIAFVLSLILSVPLALLVTRNNLAERILLPLFDIIQSIPVLAFFPVVIIFFIKVNFFNGAAIFIIFLSMLWNIVFNLVGGLKIVPGDIKAAAKVFKIKGWAFVRQITLPSIFPHIVTGSLLAWAQAWNIIIVAEVLHTYIPGGTPGQDLFGIGSILVRASAGGQNSILLASILVMVFAIAFLNFFVWQKLLHYAERFRFE